MKEDKIWLIMKYDYRDSMENDPENMPVGYTEDEARAEEYIRGGNHRKGDAVRNFCPAYWKIELERL